MIHLHWIASQPTPYNDYLFGCLAADPEIDLTVHFMVAGLPTHPWKRAPSRDYRWRPYRRLLGINWELLRTASRQNTCLFVIGGNWFDPTVIALANWLIIHSGQFVMWSDTPELRRRHTLKAIARRWWLNRVYRHAFRVMGTGKGALAAHREEGCNAEKLINFPLFIDISQFRPASICPTPTVFLSSGRLVNTIKGHDLAIRALAMARQRTGKAAHYRIAGTGPDEASLRTLATEMGLREDIEFAGWLEADELPDFYHSGHVLLHPSHRDNYAVSILEAMACGLTVIASDRTMGALDRIVHGENGLIHRAGDADDLADKIVSVLERPESIKQMGEAARRTAEQWPGSRAVEIIKEIAHDAG